MYILWFRGRLLSQSLTRTSQHCCNRHPEAAYRKRSFVVLRSVLCILILPIRRSRWHIKQLFTLFWPHHFCFMKDWINTIAFLHLLALQRSQWCCSNVPVILPSFSSGVNWRNIRLFKELRGQNSFFSGLTINIISFKLLLRIGTLSEMLSGANKDLKASALTDGNKARVLHLLSHPLLWYVSV